MRLPRLSTDVRRALFLLAVLVTLAGLAVPLFVPQTGSHELSYVGTDYDATGIHQAAYLHGSLEEDTRRVLTASHEDGTVPLAADSRLARDYHRDVRVSVVRTSQVEQYRLSYTPDVWWRPFHDEATLVGVLGMVAVVAYGNLLPDRDR